MNPQLTVELVPQTCWFSNVRDHVSKATWDLLRKRTYKQANYRCSVCGGRGPKWPVECHEIWHYDDQKKVQKLLGLTALCPSCHEVKHIGLAGVRGRRQQACEHLARVNGWTCEQVEEDLEEVWFLWSKRSQHQWKLDLSWRERTIRNKNRREKVRLTDQKRQKAEGRGERELEERPRVNRVNKSHIYYCNLSLFGLN